MNATMPSTEPKNIAEYISRQPPKVRRALQAVRRAIRKAAPNAKEAISYKIPTFVMNGRNLVHFAAFRNHIGLYPAPITLPKFKKELSRYAASKSTARFPLDQPMPAALISRIVKFRVADNLKNTKPKKKTQRA